MKSFFNQCKILSKISVIYECNIYNDKDMNNILYNSMILSPITDIFKWNSYKICNMTEFLVNLSSYIQMSGIFNLHLENKNNIPYSFIIDISKSNIFNKKKGNKPNFNFIRYMPYYCLNLGELLDCLKWNINKMNDINILFYNCSSLIKDSSKRITNNININK